MSKGGNVSKASSIALLGTQATNAKELGITYEQYGMYGGDYSYLCAAAGNKYNPCKNARTFDNPLGCIAPGPKVDLQNMDDTSQQVSDDAETDYNDELFGSYHTGVSNFLLGDGSVHPVSVTSPTDVLRKLGDISDGHAVTLP
jgi:hypothetical protein